METYKAGRNCDAQVTSESLPLPWTLIRLFSQQLSIFEVQEDHFSSLWIQHHQHSHQTCIAGDHVRPQLRLMSTLSSSFMYKGKSRDYGLSLSAESRIFISLTIWLGTLIIWPLDLIRWVSPPRHLNSMVDLATSGFWAATLGIISHSRWRNAGRLPGHRLCTHMFYCCCASINTHHHVYFQQ